MHWHVEMFFCISGLLRLWGQLNAVKTLYNINMFNESEQQGRSHSTWNAEMLETNDFFYQARRKMNELKAKLNVKVHLQTE